MHALEYLTRSAAEENTDQGVPGVLLLEVLMVALGYFLLVIELGPVRYRFSNPCALCLYGYIDGKNLDLEE